MQAERLVVDPNFNPESGFVRRPNMRKSFAQLRFSPRPKSNRTVRKYSTIASWNHIDNAAGQLETRTVTAEFAVEFQNSDRVGVNYTNAYEFLPRPFTIAPRIVLPVAGYRFDTGPVFFPTA